MITDYMGGVYRDPQKWLRNIWMTPYDKRISKKTSNDEYDSLNENLNTQMQNQTQPFFHVGVHPLSKDLEIKLHLYIFHTFLQCFNE